MHIVRNYEPACVTRDQWYPRGWDIGPTFDGPLPGPSWIPKPMSTPKRATDLFTYICTTAWLKETGSFHYTLTTQAPFDNHQWEIVELNCIPS